MKNVELNSRHEIRRCSLCEVATHTKCSMMHRIFDKPHLTNHNISCIRWMFTCQTTIQFVDVTLNIFNIASTGVILRL